MVRDALQALAMAIDDHEDMRKLMATVEPEKRKIAYETLRGLVSFQLKPLDEYIRMNGEFAERHRLPTLNTETGELTAFEPARNAVEKAAELAIHKGMDVKQGVLVLTCPKCTYHAEYSGFTVVSAVTLARADGWKYDAVLDREICPKCA